MAEDDGEKSQDPTPHRRQQVREEGQVAHSQDLSSAGLLLGGLVRAGASPAARWSTFWPVFWPATWAATAWMAWSIPAGRRHRTGRPANGTR